MQPILMSRRVEVRALDFKRPLHHHATFSDSEIFVRAEYDVTTGFIVSISHGAGSRDDLHAGRIDWVTHATSPKIPAHLPEHAHVKSFNPSRLGKSDLSRKYFADVRAAMPQTFPGSANQIRMRPEPSEVPSSAPRPDSSTTAGQEGQVAPARQAAATSPTQPHGLTALISSRETTFPSLKNLASYSDIKPIEDPNERARLEENFKVLSAFRDGWAIEEITARFGINKLRLERLLQSLQKKGRDALLMPKRRTRRSK